MDERRVKIGPLRVHSEEVTAVSFSPCGNNLVSGSKDKTILVWDVSTGKVLREIICKDEVFSVTYSPNGHFILAGGWGLLSMWNVADDTATPKVFQVDGHRHILQALFSPDGSVCLWNVPTGELVKKLKLRHDVISVAFSPVDEPVVIGSHTRYVTSVVFSPSDGKHIASGSEDKTICIWDVECRELAVGPLTGHKGWVRAIAYSPDGTRLVSGSNDKTVRIWISETGQLLSTLNGHSDWIRSVAYSFDGSYIVSGSKDNTILVWDAQSGQIVCGPITGHDKSVTSVCFSPDGMLILSGSHDKTARVWDAITGQPLFPPFSGHTRPIVSVCFFPDGRHFATGSFDGTIRIWTLNAIPNDTDWELRNVNWVVSENGKLMMWIPDDLRRHLYRPRNVSILGSSFHIKLHFGTE